MKINRYPCVLSISVLVLATCGTACFADDNGLRSWQMDERKYELERQNKILLQQTDGLENKVFQLKKHIHYLTDELNATYTTLETARQQLYEVRQQMR